MDALAKTSGCGRGEYALDGVILIGDGGDFTPDRGEIQRRCFGRETSDQHPCFTRWSNGADHHVISLKAPVLRPSHLSQQFHPAAPPRLVARKPEAAKNDAIDFLHEQEFSK